MNHRRQGYALIEVLVLITVVAVMLTLCAGMIHLLMKLDRAGRSATEVANDLASLARDFRQDAHASTTLEPPERAPERIRLTIDNGRTIEYEIRPRNRTQGRFIQTHGSLSRSAMIWAIQIAVRTGFMRKLILSL